MPSYHTWHELHTVLIALGYNQVITRNDRLVYVHGQDKMVIQKLNKLDVAYVLVFCREVGIRYMDFLNIYEKEYERQNKKANLTP